MIDYKNIFMAIPKARLNDGIYSVLPFDNVYTDTLGTASLSVNTATSFVSGRFNNAVHFNGLTSTLQYSGIDVRGVSKFSVSFFMNRSTNKTCIIASQYSTGNNGRLWVVSHLVNGSVRFVICSADGGADNYGDTVTGLISNGTWVHVACVFDGTKTGNSERLKIYINGDLQTLTFTGTIGNVINPTTNYNMWVGSLFNNTQLYYNGAIDELYIWKNKALNSIEVNSLVNKNYPF